MSLSAKQIEELRKPLDKGRIHGRKVFEGGGERYVDYLPGWDCIDAANRIFGFGQWAYQVVGQPWKIDGGTRTGNKVWELWGAVVELQVDGCPFTFREIGTTTRSGDNDSGLDMAIKGAVTDGMKRCLRAFGEQFGNVLYDKQWTPEKSQQEYRQSLAQSAQELPGATPVSQTLLAQAEACVLCGNPAIVAYDANGAPVCEKHVPQMPAPTIHTPDEERRWEEAAREDNIPQASQEAAPVTQQAQPQQDSHPAQETQPAASQGAQVNGDWSAQLRSLMQMNGVGGRDLRRVMRTPGAVTDQPPSYKEIQGWLDGAQGRSVETLVAEAKKLKQAARP